MGGIIFYDNFSHRGFNLMFRNFKLLDSPLKTCPHKSGERGLRGV